MIPFSVRAQRALGRVLLPLAAAATLTGAAQAQSTPTTALRLTARPMYVAPEIPPNVLMTLDDSNSMLGASGASYWRCDQPQHESIRFNPLAFNPAVIYTPPAASMSGVREPDANFHAVEAGPYSRIVIDLGKDFVPVEQDRPTSQYQCFMGGRYLPAERAYYYDHEVASGFIKRRVSAAQEQNYANWYLYYRTRFAMVRSVMKDVIADLRPNSLRLAWTSLNWARVEPRVYPYTSGTWYSDPFSSKNWISTLAPLDDTQFDAMRFWLNNNAYPVGNTPLRYSMIRARHYFSRSDPGNPYETVPGSDRTELACRKNYHLIVTDGGDTTGTSALQPKPWIAAPSTSSLPRSLPSPDPALTGAPTLGNYDPRRPESRLYAEPAHTHVSMNDVSFDAWATDLRPDLRNLVPPSLVDGGGSPAAMWWNPRNDPATWQHLTTYAVGVAMATSIAPTDQNVERLRAGTASFAGTPEDGFWRAVLASRGSLLLAERAEETKASLRAIFNAVASSQGTGGGVALQGSSVRAGDMAYVSAFVSGVWSGSLQAITLSARGANTGVVWDAACKLTGGTCAATGADGGAPRPAPDARVILTSRAPALNADGAIALRWNALSSAQRDALGARPPAGVGADAWGQARLNWLRGDRSAEAANAIPRLRARASVLGDIVHSQAQVIGRPRSGYADSGWPAHAPEAASAYSAFAIAQVQRARMIYVGANDGMLHAFDTDGTEKFAYVPQGLLSRLGELSLPGYQHRAYVDATPAIRDAMIGNAWKTVLVGGLGAGGTGLYALDVTSPTGINETHGNLLWDITGDDSRADLGHIYAPPTLARLADGHWWAIAGNGYNSASGKAALILVRLDGGDYRVLRTSTVSDPRPGAHRANGLSAVAVSDFNHDMIGEYAYAGDLYGNVWKFDLTDASPARWGVYQTAGLPLLAADTTRERALTAAPRIGRARDGTIVIVLGSGKELEDGDDQRGAHTDQVILGLFDHQQKTALDRARIVEQTLTASTTAGHATRAISDHDVPASSDGWSVLLPAAGEHVTLPAILRGNVAIVATTLPQEDDPCLGAATGFVMFIDLRTGRAPLAEDDNGVARVAPFIDINGDGQLDDADASVGGVAIDQGISGITVSVDQHEQDVILIGTRDGGIEALQGLALPGRRMSWREITRSR